MKLSVLGSGGPYPHWGLHRANSSYLIEAGDRKILLDHGFGSHDNLLKLGVSATQLTDIFITHFHYDHFGDMPRAVLSRWDLHNYNPIQIFGPVPLTSICKGFFGEHGAFAAEWPVFDRNAVR